MIGDVMGHPAEIAYREAVQARVSAVARHDVALKEYTDARDAVDAALASERKACRLFLEQVAGVGVQPTMCPAPPPPPAWRDPGTEIREGGDVWGRIWDPIAKMFTAGKIRQP